MLVDRPGAEPGLAACKAAVLPLSLSAQKKERLLRNKQMKEQTKTAVSEYNYTKAIPIGDSPPFGWYFGRRKRKA